MDKRDSSGNHTGEYWGNFVPQIPHQLMLRYTKKGDWVLDTFLGSGTTLIECKRLGRNGIGIELQSKIAKEAEKLISEEDNPHNIQTQVMKGDTTGQAIKKALEKHSLKSVQMAIMHPPYLGYH